MFRQLWIAGFVAEATVRRKRTSGAVQQTWPAGTCPEAMRDKTGKTCGTPPWNRSLENRRRRCLRARPLVMMYGNKAVDKRKSFSVLYKATVSAFLKERVEKKATIDLTTVR